MSFRSGVSTPERRSAQRVGRGARRRPASPLQPPGGRGAALRLGRGSPASSRVLLGYGRDEGRARALPSGQVVAEDY